MNGKVVWGMFMGRMMGLVLWGVRMNGVGRGGGEMVEEVGGELGEMKGIVEGKSEGE